MIRSASLLSAAALLLLGGCKTVPQDYVQFHAGQDPDTIAERIAKNVGACWFDGKHAAFADYSYTPELTSYSNRPRVLVVPKEEPHGLPLLVIEVRGAKRGSDVKLFGPLMASGEAESIRSDVGRWTGGARDC